VKQAEFPITLVSPHARGERVRAAQHALTGNRYRDFMEGSPVDGEFGPWTARATFRAKFELGWPRANQQYGDDIHDILTGAKALTAAQKARRKKRLKEKTKRTLGDRTWEEAGKDVAARITESPPGSNRNYITLEAYRLVGAWCAMAASVWSSRGGSKIPVLGRGAAGRYHYCPTIMNDATAGANGLTLVKTSEVKRGDWVLFDWGSSKDGVADHVGIFGEWLTVGQTFRTREGNTSYEGHTGSQSDGGAAAERVRRITDVARNQRGDLGFVRLER
jgi:hypothetical protein